MIRVSHVLTFVTAAVCSLGCNQPTQVSEPSTVTNQPIDPTANKEQKSESMKPGEILVANSDGAASVDALSFRELLKRTLAEDDVGLKELRASRKILPFDKGQRFRLIEAHRISFETTDGTKHYRLQVRAIGGHMADKEMYVLSLLLAPEADAKSKE